MISTDCTAKCLLLPISIMITSDWAFSWSGTYGKFVLLIFAYIVSCTLSLMTRLAEMSISPTEPLSCRTAKFAFKFNEILPVFATVLNWNLTTIGTYQLLFFIVSSISCLVHSICAIFSSSEIGIFAFETHKIGVYSHGVLGWLIVIWRFRIL